MWFIIFHNYSSLTARGTHVNLAHTGVVHAGQPRQWPPPLEQLISTSLYTVTVSLVHQFMHRKVMLSAAAAACPCSYAAMLILAQGLGVPLFVTSDDPVWWVALSRGGIKDTNHTIHH
uniref:Uncharacterized protein n=1 Tax=Oryza glumipatula TaxID=40148 RepID=A0A0D9ZGW2_9ORYZ